MKKFLLLVAVVCCFFAVASFATEGGGGAYPNGAEDFMAGAVPPPGFYYINYMVGYFSDTFRDSRGKSSVPGFKLTVIGNVSRLIYVTDKKILGGNWAMHMLVPLVNVDVKTPAGDDSKFGLGDIFIDPCIVSWHSKNLHSAAGVEIIIPTGAYDKKDIANVGRNYWTIEPVFAFTYLSDSGWEISGKFMYDINFENDATDYKSGQEFHCDYTIGKRINSRWTAGIGGYWYIQTTDDKQNGIKVGDGNKGNVFAIGPQIKYDSGKLSFILKYQKEISVENKPEGSKVWLKIVAPL
ncbi:MAG: transporter [Candidatus Omnitrophica bacterium]|nr:transporter [Candidatus Omnitrophota bacterium]